MRFAPIQEPRSSPYRSIAWYVYAEQVGEYRQLGGIQPVSFW